MAENENQNRSTDSSPKQEDVPPTAESDAVADILVHLAALGDYVSHYVIAKVDSAGIRVRNLITRVLIGVVLVCLLITTAIVFSVYLIRGIAGGLAAAVGHEWLGFLLTGFLGLGAIALFFGSAKLRSQRTRMQKRAVKYAQRRARQRAKFGHDVEQAARVAA